MYLHIIAAIFAVSVLDALVARIIRPKHDKMPGYIVFSGFLVSCAVTVAALVNAIVNAIIARVVAC